MRSNEINSKKKKRTDRTERKVGGKERKGRKEKARQGKTDKDKAKDRQKQGKRAKCKWKTSGNDSERRAKASALNKIHLGAKSGSGEEQRAKVEKSKEQKSCALRKCK